MAWRRKKKQYRKNIFHLELEQNFWTPTDKYV
jgi:hypothetical protein